jgi:hypothetical protein
MAGLQFVLEDKARTEQKYKKQIQILQVSWYHKNRKVSEDCLLLAYSFAGRVKKNFKMSNRMYTNYPVSLPSQ